MNTEVIDIDRQVIDTLGGPAKVAARLGYDLKCGGVQRVHNWRTRGIPAAVKVAHPELFLFDRLIHRADCAVAQPSAAIPPYGEKPEQSDIPPPS